MAAPIWKKYFLMWRAAPASPNRRGRRRYDPAKRDSLSSGLFVVACVRHGAALLVSAALVVAARARSDVLANRADEYVGLVADLYWSTKRRARAGGTNLHRRGDVVGHAVPRPAWVF